MQHNQTSLFAQSEIAHEAGFHCILEASDLLLDIKQLIKDYYAAFSHGRERAAFKI